MSGQGTQGAMLKKKFPHADLHMNSNIVIHMDEKPRLKSQYMKKYTESVRSDNLQRIQARPAGTINFRRGHDEQKHLNNSRRRILNDFVTPQQNASLLEVHANRNKSQLLKMQDAPRQDSLSKYEYPGPTAQIVGPAGRPGLMAQQANRMRAARGEAHLDLSESKYRLPQLEALSSASIYATLPTLPSANRKGHQGADNSIADRDSMPHASQRDMNELQRLSEVQQATAKLINPKSQTRSVTRHVTKMDQNQFFPEGNNAPQMQTFDEGSNYN